MLTDVYQFLTYLLFLRTILFLQPVFDMWWVEKKTSTVRFDFSNIITNNLFIADLLLSYKNYLLQNYLFIINTSLKMKRTDLVFTSKTG